MNRIPIRSKSISGYLQDARDTLKAYFLGQSLVAVMLGLSTWAGLALFGLPGALWLGICSAVLCLIPVLGILLAFVITLIVALFQTPVWSALGAVCVVFLVVQLLEGLVFLPLILGRSLGLNPVFALGALLGFGLLLGPFGILLGVPLAAIAWKWNQRWRANASARNRTGI